MWNTTELYHTQSNNLHYLLNVLYLSHLKLIMNNTFCSTGTSIATHVNELEKCHDTLYCPALEQSCYSLSVQKQNEENSPHFRFRQNQTNGWKLLAISGLKSWPGSNKASSQCICDLSVCSGLKQIHSHDVQFSTRLAGARSCG